MKHKGFTLLEVLVAVMLLVVVITALLRVQADTTQGFLHLAKKRQTIGYATLLQGGSYGFVKEHVTLDRLIEGFDVDDALRTELKQKRMDISYQREYTLDDAPPQEQAQEEQDKDAALAVELGLMNISIDANGYSFVRIRLQ